MVTTPSHHYQISTPVMLSIDVMAAPSAAAPRARGVAPGQKKQHHLHHNFILIYCHLSIISS